MKADFKVWDTRIRACAIALFFPRVQRGNDLALANNPDSSFP
jgi:hypothetical protein